MFFGVDEFQLKIVERLLVAFVAGVIIGFDRERSGKAAGIRTQMLVCVGSALMAGISVFLGKWYGNSTVDPARLMAQVITGIGFLGAGVILKNGNKVSGVTTAATIWITSAVGLSIGAGLYLPALCTILLVLLLNPLAILQYKYGLKGDVYVIKVRPQDERKLEIILSRLGMDLRGRAVKNRHVFATIVSSNQRNLELRTYLKKAKIIYDLVLSEE